MTTSATLDIASTTQFATEGDSGATPFVFTVTRSGDTSVSAAANWAITNTTFAYTLADDYAGGVIPSGVVSFAPGETSKTLTVEVAGDTTLEYNEGFAVTLSGPTLGTVIGTASAAATIVNDDGFTGFRLWAIDGSQTFFSSSISRYEGNSGATPFVYAIVRAGDLSAPASVDWSVAGTGANPADGADFVGGALPAGTASFAAGQALALITLDVQGDTAFEDFETFTLSLGNPTGAALGSPVTSDGTIQNDDLPPGGSVAITSGSVTHAEGGPGATTDFVYTLTRSGETSPAATVAWHVVGTGSNPANGADFVGGALPAGTASFAAGQTTQTVTVAVAGDATLENNEAFTLVLDSASGTSIGLGTTLPTTALGTITNDDSQFTIQQTPQGLIYEGNSGSQPQIFTITRFGALTSGTTLVWNVTGRGAAQADGADFAGGVLPSGTLSFAPGVTSQTITIGIAGDTTVEADEGFLVSMSSPDPNVTIGASYVVSPSLGNLASFAGTILNDDRAVSIAATDATKPEGDSGATAFTFTVSRSALSYEPGTTDIVKWAVGGTGANSVNSADFVGGMVPSGTLTFAPGVLSQTITVNIQGDTIVEPDETFRVVLTAATPGNTITTAQAIGTVLNDDGLPATGTISIAGDAGGATIIQNEGNTGATDYVFTLTRTGNTSLAASVDYAVTGFSNDSAYPGPFTSYYSDATGADFVGGALLSGSISFAAGQVSQTLTVQVQGDSALEPSEAFAVTLSNPTSATIGTAVAYGAITNDDSRIDIHANASSYYETNGTKLATFLLTRSGDTSTAATVAWNVAGSTGVPASNATPAPASEFVGGVLPSGTVSFAPGQVTADITIAIAGNSLPQPDLGFTVTLSDPSPGASLGTASADQTILNDDSAISVAATDADHKEGDSGSTAFVFTVTRTNISDMFGGSGNPGPPITVTWAVGGYGANSANPADFAGGIVPSGTLSFASDVASQTITISVAGDTTPEADEQFRVLLTGSSSGTTITTAEAVGVIRNDDINFAVSTATPSQYEGNSGLTPYVFTVTRQGGTGTDSVGWAVLGATAHSAGPNDFAPGQAMSGRLTFAPGQTSQTVTINVQGDSYVEPDEGFLLRLQGASAGTRITTGEAQASIRNDDTGLSVAPLDADKYEGDSGATHFTFTITRTGLLGAGDTVRWAATGSGGAPPNPADFVGGVVPTGTVTFAAGQSTAIVTVDIQGDQTVEPDETFQLALGAAHAGAGNGPIVITTARADATIRNDDTGLSIAAVNPVQAEGDAGETDFVFTVTRTGTLAGTDSASWLLTGLAPDSVGPNDFVAGAPLSGTLVFAPGQASKTITIAVHGDTYVEPDEHFRVLLRTPSAGVTITGNHADATILNDDSAPASVPAPTLYAIAATDADKPEGDSGSTPFVFTVTRSGDTSAAGSVTWSAGAIGGHPVNRFDFAGGVVPSGTLSFAAGETSRTLTIDVAGDLSVEPDETFLVAIGSPSAGGVIATRSAAGTIRADESGFSITATDAAKPEGDGGVTNYYFRVFRSGDLGAAATVEWVAGRTADANTVSSDDFAGGLAPSGTLSFAPGENTQLITIGIAGDLAAEGDETFQVALGAPSSGSILTRVATGTVQNDDTVVRVIPPSPSSLAEGSGGDTPFVFTLRRFGDLTGADVVNWAVTTKGVTGYVLASQADFAGGVAPSGSVTFAPGQVDQPITVLVAGDTRYEDNEAFAVHISGPTTHTPATHDAVAVILNDDAGFGFASTLPIQIDEGASRTVTVSRFGDTSATQTVQWQLVGSGANPANAADFTGPLSGTLTFAPGVVGQAVTIATANDPTLEPAEGFRLLLSAPGGGASIKDPALDGTILNNDSQLSISALDAVKPEGDSGATPFVFLLSRSGNAYTSECSGTWVAYGVGSDPATGSDFAGRVNTGGFTFFGPEATLTIDIAGDTLAEADEHFRVLIQLDPASRYNTTIGTNTADATILNDDLLPGPAPLAAPPPAADAAPAGGLADPWSPAPVAMADALHGA